MCGAALGLFILKIVYVAVGQKLLEQQGRCHQDQAQRHHCAANAAPGQNHKGQQDQRQDHQQDASNPVHLTASRLR